MIIVQLKGGLGNQMFQYAAGRALARQKNTILKIDLSYLSNGVLGENVAYRKYGLNRFHIVENIITDEELKSFIRKSRIFSKSKITWLNRKLSYRIPLSTIINQNGHGYDPMFFTQSKNSFLVGYWQSAEFFRGSEEIIRKDFRFKDIPDSANKELFKAIGECESVAVHIRRGDFKNLPVLGMTGTGYYLKAISYLVERISNPVLYFFSDEMNWVKENFNSVFTGIPKNFAEVNNSAGSEADDLRLMSNCKHNIIGNSTFGWWGAWLNSNPEKIVIAPETLFADREINAQLQTMIPCDWIRL